MKVIIATSPNYVASSPFLSLYQERCRVVPLPVDTEELRRVSIEKVEALRAEFGRFVLFVGRHVYYKGLDYLIEAMGKVEKIRLLIVGQGPLEKAHQAQVERLGLQERVIFLGKVPDYRLKVLYHACQCLILPSVARAEAFGMVLAEAMACGKPVVSTELSTGTSFINRDGETGFVVPPGNVSALAERIERLVWDRRLREVLGSKARQWVDQECRKETVIDRTLELYQKVVHRSDEARVS